MNPVAAAAIIGSRESGVVGATMQTVSMPWARGRGHELLRLLGRQVEREHPSTPAARASRT